MDQTSILTQPVPFPRGWRAGLIVVISFLAFFPSLRNEPVFDDRAQVAELKPASNPAEWLRSAADPWWGPEKQKSVWRPVTRMAILAQKSLVEPALGADVYWPYHVVSILLHALACILAMHLALAFGFDQRAAMFGALMLAVQPLRSEAVNQIVGQSELLAAAFMLGGMLAFVRMKRVGSSAWVIALVQSIFLALAVGAKEHAVLYPVYVGLIEVWLRKRSDESRRPIKAIWPVALAFAAVSAFFLTGKYYVTGMLLEPSSSIPDYENVLATMSFTSRAAASMEIFAFFLVSVVLFPFSSPDFSSESLSFHLGWEWWFSWVGLIIFVGIVGWMFWCLVKRRPVGLLILAGLLSWGITSNLFFVIGVPMACRLWYFPSIIPSMMFACCVLTQVKPLKTKSWRTIGDFSGYRLERVVNYLFMILLCFWLWQTWAFSEAWRNEFQFARATLSSFPRNWRANHNIAREYYKMKDFEKGFHHAALAVQIRPNEAQSWDLVGLNAMFLPGHTVQAETAFKNALTLDPNLELARQHLNNLKAMQKNKL